MLRKILAILCMCCLAAGALATAAETDKKDKEGRFKAATFTGLALRGIGPAFMSGRIADIVVDPTDRSVWYVAVASGGVWKTINAGTSWTPIFDDQGSYSIGCLAIDTKQPLVVWVGTGENNSQRSVGYGDGVYKSVDGGKSWTNVGLKASEHIGKILIDPRDSNVVYVAAQGPLWGPGGDRGLYKTTDGGKTWKRVLEISENTGVSDIAFDPRNPDVIYATAYQRRRHVWTLINGGPESALYKTTDAGTTWKKLESGLPKEEMGRIGIAVSPVSPDVVYAIIEAVGKEAGFYRSIDAGANWEKRGDYVSGGPQYYHEIFADPWDVDRVYSMDVWMMVTEDGGKTFKKVGERFKHVDNHALVFDPADRNYLLAGCDGGVYETWDLGATWNFKANLPVTQFYKVALDNDRPFYNVYGGTQDNNTQGGPSRTRTSHGIRNADWFVTVGGDGFKPQVDPEDPNIVYSQYQYGGLVRFDKRNGEKIDIQPQPGAGEEALRWNWDSPLILSPHSARRLYYAANRLFRSDDRGDSWKAVSGDLSRRIDRNKLKVMDRIWSVDSVAKNASTSFYGNIVALTESPKQEGLIYAGSDDGLIQVTEDGGSSWRKIETVPGVPEMTYVSDLEASRHDPATVYATFNNHKMADFKPYVLKSTNRGRSWSSIAGDLPERGSVWCIAEDHASPDLLFAGTEFGLYFTVDGGKHWVQLKGGIPVIAVRDLEIQRRESDLVVATFGRGFYILDDYTPLRAITAQKLEEESMLFPVKDPPMYIPAEPLGWLEKGSQGDAYFTAPNPPFGAVFTYYLRDEIQTRKKSRREAERKTIKEGGDVLYPSWDSLRAEDREEEPAIVLTVTDEDGHVVRRISGPVTAGFHRVAWDLRHPATNPTDLRPAAERDPWDEPPTGPLALPGRYSVKMEKRVGGIVTPLGDARSFEAIPIGSASLPATDRAALLDFERKTARLQRAVLASVEVAKDVQKRLDFIRQALLDTPSAPPTMADDARRIANRLKDLQVTLSGDPSLSKRNEPVPPSVVDRVQRVVGGLWSSTSAPTATQRTAYEIAAQEFEAFLPKLRDLVDGDLRRLEDAMEAAGSPWTPGRFPRWAR